MVRRYILLISNNNKRVLFVLFSLFWCIHLLRFVLIAAPSSTYILPIFFCFPRVSINQQKTMGISFYAVYFEYLIKFYSHSGGCWACCVDLHLESATEMQPSCISRMRHRGLMLIQVSRCAETERC